MEISQDDAITWLKSQGVVCNMTREEAIAWLSRDSITCVRLDELTDITSKEGEIFEFEKDNTMQSFLIMAAFLVLLVLFKIYQVCQKIKKID